MRELCGLQVLFFLYLLMFLNMNIIPSLALDLADPNETAINTISINDVSSNLTGFNEYDQDHVTISEFTITNNDPDSFKVTISSTNGAFRHSTYSSSATEGRYINYTVKIYDPGTGTLGSTPPTLPTNHNLAASGDGNLVLTFSSATTGTENKVYEVQLSSDKKVTLLRGQYSDQITITIVSL